MGDNEQKAMQLMAEAEKKLNSSKTFLGSLFGGSSKVEDAIDCYLRAANLFKMSKKWSQAGQAFSCAAQLHLKAEVRHDAATNYVDAANCYKKGNPSDAIVCLLKAVELYTHMGRFTTAAKQHQTIAEMCETDLNDLKKAMEHYELAADFFRGEESISSANKCMLKLAQYAAQTENYTRAIEIYEQIAISSLDNSLLKYSAKEYMFRALLCHLCLDALNAQHALERYNALYPAFADSRECKLIKDLIEHLEDQNLEGFTEAVKTYDSISRLDHWYTIMLGKVKKQIDDQPDLR